jgi:regulatory protein
VPPTGNGYELTISALEEPLMVSPSMYHRHRLKEGIVITPPQLEQLVTESARELCDQAVGRLLGYREHSVGEMRRKLRQRRFTPDVIEETLRKYIRNGLLDDHRYATRLAQKTLGQKPSGKAFVAAVLQRKGIGRDLAAEIVDELFEDADETDLALAALESRWAQWRQIDVETARRKAYNYLSRRGIGYEAAKAAFEMLHGRTSEVED